MQTILEAIHSVARERGYTIEHHAVGRGRYEYAVFGCDSGQYFMKAGHTR